MLEDEVGESPEVAAQRPVVKYVQGGLLALKCIVEALRIVSFRTVLRGQSRVRSWVVRGGGHTGTMTGTGTGYRLW